MGKVISHVNSEDDFSSSGTNVSQSNKRDFPKLYRDEEVMNSSVATNTSEDFQKNPEKSGASVSEANNDNRSISMEDLMGKSYYKREKDFGENLSIPASKMAAESNKSTKSEGAVIVIPIQVESLSKIELILVEHTNGEKKKNTDKEYIPCLNCYKWLVFHRQYTYPLIRPEGFHPVEQPSWSKKILTFPS